MVNLITLSASFSEKLSRRMFSLESDITIPPPFNGDDNVFEECEWSFRDFIAINSAENK